MTITLQADSPAGEELSKLTEFDFGDDVTYPENVAQPLRNAYRAARLAPAIAQFADSGNELGEPLETIIRDVLTDLIHLADLIEDDTFDNLLHRARDMAAMEQSE